MKAIFGHFEGFAKLLLLVLMVFVSFMVLSMLALLAALPFVEGFSITDGSMTMSDNLLRYLQIVQSISVFIVPSLLAGLLFWGHQTLGLGFKHPRALMVAFSVLIIVAAQPLVSYLGVWNTNMQLPEFMSGLEQWMERSEKSANEIIIGFLDTDNTALLLLNLLMIAILPAIGEEMLFRGALQPILGEWSRNKHLAVWATALIFSAIHMQFFTFMPRFFLGLALGYLMLYGKNLWYPVAGHFANNFLSLIVFYYYRQAHPDINPLEPGAEDMSTFWVFPATAVMMILFWRFVVIKEEKE